MRSAGSRVPIPLRLAVRLLPREVREEVLGDLLEHWNLRVSDQPWLARVAWAWRQPVSVLVARLWFGRRAEKPRLGIRRDRRVGLGISWLDVKLALRMLFKQPGLTLVAIFALAIGIPIGLLPLHVMDSLTVPLPVENGEEIVAVHNYDLVESRPVVRSLYDFVQWREELSSFEDLGMWRRDPYNVITGD